jgi:hypothetical protein
MADVDYVFQGERLDELGQVVRISVHVVAVPGLAGTPMAAPVMGYAAAPSRGEKKHLVFPRIRGQRPAVAEDNGLTFAPILEVNLSAIFCGHCIHNLLSFRVRLFNQFICAFDWRALCEPSFAFSILSQNRKTFH